MTWRGRSKKTAGKKTRLWKCGADLLCPESPWPPFFIGWFPNHHYFSRDLSSSKRNHHFLMVATTSRVWDCFFCSCFCLVHRNQTNAANETEKMSPQFKQDGLPTPDSEKKLHSTGFSFKGHDMTPTLTSCIVNFGKGLKITRGYI